jgi:hypothetical protein
MRSRLSRKARETACSIALGVLGSGGIAVSGYFARNLPFCDSGS